MKAKEKRRQTVERQFRWHLYIILFCLLFLIGVSITVLAADDYHVTGQNSVTRIFTSGAKKLINSNSALTINGSGTLELSGIAESGG